MISSFTEPGASLWDRLVNGAPPMAPLLFPNLVGLALIGLWALRRQRVSLLILLGWGLLPYLFLAGIPYQNIHFPLIVMPAVAVLDHIA